MSKLVKIIVVVVVLGACAAGAGIWYAHRSAPPVNFRTVSVIRGDLLVTISATGTVEPEDTVDVGAQVTGIVSEFGTDANGNPIDYGSPVKANALLAKIDDKLFVADVTSAKATVDQQKAGVKRAEADIKQLNASLYKAQRDWERAQRLGVSDALAQSDYDNYQSAYETALANVAVGEASLAQAQALVPQAEAALQRAQQNLNYCTIVSPVDGFVIDRRVNIGQTVVSSLSASSIFLIGKDRQTMTIWANVNEADIGKIKVGQNVSFTVDAFADRKFHGKVSRIRWNAAMTSNVVVYTVEIEVENDDLTLIPYLTANVNFQVARHEGVLQVPNAALRWAPTSTDMIEPDLREKYASMAATSSSGRGGGGRGSGGFGGGGTGGGGGGGRSMRGGAGSGSISGAGANREQADATTQPAVAMADDGKGGPTTRRSHRGDGAGGENQRGMVWVQVGQFVKPVSVTIGPSDGINTEVKSDDLKENDQLVTGEITAAEAASEDTTNPFAPKFPGRRR